MFPESEIPKKVSCGNTKIAAVVKEALVSHYLNKMLHNMSTFFLVLMYVSNDKADKSCIILVKIFNEKLKGIRTCFLDMPAVNIGNTLNPFAALKESLQSIMA